MYGQLQCLAARHIWVEMTIVTFYIPQLMQAAGLISQRTFCALLKFKSAVGRVAMHLSGNAAHNSVLVYWLNIISFLASPCALSSRNSCNVFDICSVACMILCYIRNFRLLLMLRDTSHLLHQLDVHVRFS